MRSLGLAVLVVLAVAAPASAQPWVAVTANGGSSSVSTIDVASGAAGAPLAVGGTLGRLAIAPDARTGYVAIVGDCNAGGAVQAIDLAVSPPVLGRRIALGRGVSPTGLVVSPDGRTLYVGSSCAGTVVPVDLTKAAPAAGAAIRVGGAATDLAVAPGGNTLYASLRGSGSVAVVDLSRTPPSQASVRSVVVPSPGAISILPDGSTVFVADTAACTITPIDGASGAARPAIALGAAACATGPSPLGNPADLAVSPDGSQVYASSPDAAKVTPVDTDTGTVRTPIGVAGAPAGLAFTPDNSPTSVFTGFQHDRLLVTDAGGSSVQSVDATSETLSGGPIALGAGASGPFDIAVTPDQPPVARFTVAPGRTTHFDATASSPDTPAIARFIWSWGDRSSQFDVVNPSHTYARAGLYTATVTLADAVGTSTAFSTLSTGGTLLRRGGAEAQTSRTFVVGHSAVRPPVVGKRFVAEITQGRAFVRRRGSHRFRVLGLEAINVPAGSEFDTTQGEMHLTVARNKKVTDTVVVSGGRFVATQRRDAKAATTLRLSQPLTGCRGARKATAAAKRKRRRRRTLHTVEETGNFKTKGSFAATSVEGTTWDTTDRCRSTEVAVSDGLVTVRDLVRKRTFAVRAGQSYTARAR